MSDQIHHDRAPSSALSSPVQLSADEYRQVHDALTRRDQATVDRILAAARARSGRADCACEHRDSEADAAAALRARLASAWREAPVQGIDAPAPIQGSGTGGLPVVTTEEDAKRLFRQRLANAWRSE